MCRVLALLGLLAGCSFPDYRAEQMAGAGGPGSVGGGGAGGAGSVADGGEANAGETNAGETSTGPASLVPCTPRKVWQASFDTDPTLADSNNDGTPDWTIRGGHPFPVSQLSGGVWQAPNGQVLDTAPNDDFGGRTQVVVRLRSTSLPSNAAIFATHFWINLDEGNAQFAALMASVILKNNGTQAVYIAGKSDSDTEVALLDVPGLSNGMVEVALDIDMTHDTVDVIVQGKSYGPLALPRTGPANGEGWATVSTYGCTGEFDSVTVTACAP